MTNYPVGDFLIQIKNASLADKKELSLSSSKLIKSVAEALKKQKILNNVEEKDGQLKVSLAYHNKKPVLLDLKLVSKPGLRIYRSVDEIKNRRRKNASFLIISTPKGILSSEEAIKENSGGEVLAEIW